MGKEGDRFRGATGIVTGASRGLGRLIAVALAKRGVNLALAARTAEGLQETVAAVTRHGVRAIPVRCDVRNKDDLHNLVDTTVAELGPPDLLINNAGIESVADYAAMELDEIENVMVTNTISPMLLTRLVVPHMAKRKSGHIVIISSTAGKVGMPYFATYASSKHALVGFSWSLREEFRRYGIGVSVVCPGFIDDTGMADEWALKKRPRIAPTAKPEKVVRAVVEAIEKNKADVVLASGLGRFSDIFFALSPDLSAWVMRKAGLDDYFAAEAKARPGN
jgi:short-subunit dehydrogenase